MTEPTLPDLETARGALQRLQQKFANYSGNNPNKFQSDIKAASAKVRSIEASLKTTGVIPLTDQEKLERELDAAFPDAKSKEVVEYRDSQV